MISFTSYLISILLWVRYQSRSSGECTISYWRISSWVFLKTRYSRISRVFSLPFYNASTCTGIYSHLLRIPMIYLFDFQSLVLIVFVTFIHKCKNGHTYCEECIEHYLSHQTTGKSNIKQEKNCPSCQISIKVEIFFEISNDDYFQLISVHLILH